MHLSDWASKKSTVYQQIESGKYNGKEIRDTLQRVEVFLERKLEVFNWVWKNWKLIVAKKDVEDAFMADCEVLSEVQSLRRSLSGRI